MVQGQVAGVTAAAASYRRTVKPTACAAAPSASGVSPVLHCVLLLHSLPV